MDLTESIAPKSDQLNADDLLAGAQTFTIEKVTEGNAEQPFNFHLVELPGRPYRPSKSMRRIMVSAWGKDPSLYVGRGLTLYRNPEIKFGGSEVGGIEISEMSHIAAPHTVALTVARGRKKRFTVQPLAAPVKVDWISRIDSCPDVESLRNLWREANANGATPDELSVIAAAANGGETHE